MQAMFLVLLFVLGACLGSFLCCQARRLHYRATAKKGSKPLGSRSVCLHCRHQLKWYDNIPVISWLVLRGECRKCHQKIGPAELISEIASGLAFLALGTTIDPTTPDALTWSAFIATLALTTSLIFLAIYDGLYGELPVKCLTTAIALAALVLILEIANTLAVTSFSPDLITQPLLAILILGGLYLILYKFSHGKWVGDGDWLLATAIALALASPWLALITLFIANLSACLYALPAIKKSKKIHLGPFMVFAFVITLTFADFFYYALGYWY